MSELLKKYESIDQSKLNEATVKILNRVKSITSDFTTDDDKNNKIAEQVLNEVMKKNPDAIKIIKREPKTAPKKVHKATHTAKIKKSPAPTAKKSENNIMSVAKEIQKAGESWKDAMARAKQVLKERKEQVVEKQKTELQKLYALVKTKKELKGFANSDISRDSVRDAKPRGARFVTKQGTTSNQYGTFDNKLGRKYWETRDRHADRLAPNYPKDMPLLENGGTVSNERMYNFLKDDLGQLEEAIKSGDTEEVNRFFSYWLGSWGHLKSLETKNNERMYNFLKDDLKELENAINEDNTEEVERFFSYWGQHLELLKMANGGSLPFMTDPNFGNFQNTGMFEGGGLVVKNNQDLEEVAKYMFNAVKKRKWDLKDLIYYFEKENNFDYKYRVKIWDEMNGYEMRKTYENILEMLKRIVEANGKKFELGGAFMMTDLAGHTGGSDGIGNPMTLSGVSGTHYTGLVGETGAMSSGEMFEAGGAMMQNQQVIDDASQSYVNYYINEGASQGMYKNGGSLGKSLYVAYSSYFDSKKYDTDKIISALQSVGAKNIHLENESGMSNQPEVVVFNGNKNQATDALNEAFDTDYILVYEKDWRTKKMADGGSVDDSVIDELWNGYASAVLFTETDSDSGEPLDSEYSVSDFDEETESSTKKMLAKFYLENKDAIEESELDLDTIGNDIWYTRSGQGAGFFDHSLDSEIEEQLIKGAKALGEYPSVETYDGKISVRGGRAFAKGGFIGTVEFNAGDVVWQKDEKRYATVMNNYGDPVNGDFGDIRLDTTGNTSIFTYNKKFDKTGYNLVKVGEKGDTGKFTPDVLVDMKKSANRLIDSRKESKDKEGVAYYQEVYKRLLDGEFDSMTGAKATASKKSISSIATYVPNRDVKELSVVVKGELRQLKGSDILDGVYVKNSAQSKPKLDAEKVFDKIFKDAKEAKQGKSKIFDASDLKKINLQMVQKLAEAGYSEQQIRNVILGYAFDNEILADNELEYQYGVFSYEESYIKQKIDALVEAQKNKEFVAGIEYPNFDWQGIIKKYKISSNPKDIVVKKTMGDGSRYEYYYETFIGENIVLGHNYGYKTFDKNGKLKDNYIEKGKKVIDPTKINSWQKEREYKAGFNGGYWYVVSSKIETIDDVLKTLLSQEDGYCKELELYSDSFAKTLKENNVEFADGGLLSSNEIDKLDSGFTISQLDDILRKMFPYSFGVDVFKAGKNLFDYNLDDKIKDDKLKLYFYDKSSNRELNYEVHQGQENTYFDFMLFDEEMNTYIGTFGFKDRGDVDKSYITKFVSFLHDAYHYPFQVRHSVMANGGFMSDVYANGGFFDSNEGFMRADNNRSFRYPEKEVYIETIDEPIDLTDFDNESNDVEIVNINNDIDLTDDNRIRAKLTQPSRGTYDNFLKINPSAFEFMENIPMPSSNKHKND